MFNEFAKELYKESKVVFGDKRDNIKPLEHHMLMVSEISEASDAYRERHASIYIGEDGKPEGEAVELADCLTVLLSYCGRQGFDIDRAIRIKREFNAGKRNWKSENKRF